jgi:ribosome-associated protein
MRHRHVQDFREEIVKGRLIIEPKNIALRIARVAKDKLAQKTVVLDMRRVCDFCDYFVIASATSLRHSGAISQAIEEDLEKERIKSLSKASPHGESGWIVLDYLSVIAHIFYKPMREFYSLERLWSDAKRVRIPRNVRKQAAGTLSQAHKGVSKGPQIK